MTKLTADNDPELLSTRFNGFRLSPNGKEVIYGGLTADKQPVEIRQSVVDLDVMLVLIANVLQTALGSQLGDARNHQTDTATVEPGDGGGLVLNLVSHSIVRSFHLPPAKAGQLAADLADGLRRSRLRVVT